MGIIYLLTNGEGQYKIGITKYNAKKRIKSGLQTGNGDEITVIEEFESKYNRKIESTLHRRYKAKRLKGEWFMLEKKDIQNFISECQSLHNNFEFLEDSGNPFI
jgi:hypothetical protein|tara:strand:- start:4323 stop:4634 length:312 start_codon:yes stop_codon:yes gene_type:complete